MTEHKLTCILCPLSCGLTVREAGGQVTSTAGYGCKAGREYAAQEIMDPRRMVTSTVKLEGADLTRLPVKTSLPIPQKKIFDFMQEIGLIIVNSPVICGQVIKKNVAGSGADLVATRSVPAR